MYVRYKDKTGKLIHYEYNEKLDQVLAIIKLSDNEELKVVCKEKELKVPNIMGNYKIIDEILEENKSM